MKRSIIPLMFVVLLLAIEGIGLSGSWNLHCVYGSCEESA
jgi:hypothetical protein